MTRLTVEIGDSVQARTEDGRSLRFRTRHESLMFGALALSQGRDLSRAELARLLWPEAEAESASISFRQRLCDLRRLLGDALESDRRTIRLHLPGLVTMERRTSGLDSDSALSVCRSLALAADFDRFCGDRGWTSARLARLAEGILQGESATLHAGQASLPDLVSIAQGVENRLEDRLHAALGAATLQLDGPDRRFARSAPSLLGEEVRRRPDLIRALAALFEAAAIACHRDGRWARAVMCQEEAVRLYREAGDSEALSAAEFKQARMAIDIGRFRSGYEAIGRMRQNGELSTRLMALADLNLVFAHSLAGRLRSAHESAMSFRRCPLARDSVLHPWARLNESVLFCRAGRPREAASAILEAQQEIGPPAHPLDHHWHWHQATDVFVCLGDSARTAFTDTLAQRAAEYRQESMTPINRNRFESSVTDLAARSRTQEWLAAVEEAEAVDLASAHEIVMDGVLAAVVR
ncbi:MAG: hypothetical protein MH204_07680 [Fimbriimonadaceae bacterium]|nr:hypothetical protein [Fimbriimonadaceae bacterium]